MSLIKNIIKAVYKFDEYIDFIKIKIPYCILYIFILSLLMTVVNTESCFYRYYINKGGAKGIIEELVPEFQIDDKTGVNVEGVTKKSVTVSSNGEIYSILDYIIDTSAQDIKFTRQWFKEKYNYSYEGEPALIYVTAKRTYLLYPGALKATESKNGIMTFTNYNLLTELGINSKEDVFRYGRYINVLFYFLIVSAAGATFIYISIIVLYFSLMVVLLFRLLKNKKIKYGNSFRLAVFAMTPAVLFEFIIGIVNCFVIYWGTVIQSGELFYIRIAPYTMPVIFIMYMAVVFRKNDIPMEEITSSEV